MERFPYQELKTYIHQDIEAFMKEGLTIRQATSRIQVEYRTMMEESPIEKLIILIGLCEEGIKHGFLRDDIKQETHALIESFPWASDLTPEELLQIQSAIHDIKNATNFS